MLNKDDKLIMPLPMPYDGIIYTTNDLNDFINETIKSDKQPILFLVQIGALIAEFFWNN